MSDFRARFLRRLRYEIFSFALVASVPVAIAIVFPYDAIGFHAQERDGAPPAAECAFVSLDAAEERAALAAARTAWQVDAKGVKWMKPESGPGELPPMPVVLVIPERPARGTSAAPAEYTPNSLPPTVAAPPPATIAPDDDKGTEAKQPFSKEDLLKLR